MNWMAPLQKKLMKGDKTETSQVEFVSPKNSRSRVLLSRKEERKIENRKNKKNKKNYGLEAFGVEKEGQVNLKSFLKNPIQWLMENPQLTFEDIPEQEIKPSQPEKGAVWQINRTYNGIQIRFNTKPPEEIRTRMKQAGFRWSGRQGVWYAKDTSYTRQIASELADKDEPAGEKLSYAEQVEADNQRAAARQDRLRKAIEKAESEAESRFEIAHKMADVIPFGQPILVGHHSEKCDRSYRKRIDSHMRKGVEAYEHAKELKSRMEGSEQHLSRQEDPGAVSRKLDKFETELRRLKLHEDWYKDKDEFERKVADYEEKIAYWKKVLADLGGIKITQKDVRPGDYVKYRGQWYKARRANPKTVTIEGWLGIADWTWPAEYSHISEVRSAKKNPRDVIGYPPNFIMKMQLFKLWKEVLGSEDLGDFETFMKEAADLTYDEAKEKLIKTYGSPELQGRSARYFKEKTKDAEERLHAGMCEHAGDECRKGDSEACRTACDECGLDDLCPDMQQRASDEFSEKELLETGKIRPLQRYGKTLWQYRDKDGIFTMAPDKEEAVKRANKAMKKLPEKKSEYKEPEYEIETWYLLYAPHLKESPYQLSYMIQGSWSTKSFNSFNEAVRFMQKGMARMYVHRARGEYIVKWKPVTIPGPVLKGGYRKRENIVYRLEQPHFKGNDSKWFWSVYVTDLSTGETKRGDDIAEIDLIRMDDFSETDLVENYIRRNISKYDFSDYSKAEIGELNFVRNLKETLLNDIKKLPQEKQEIYNRMLSGMVDKARAEIVRREQGEKLPALKIPDHEYYSFGTKVMVSKGDDPELEPAFRGTILRTLNAGKLIEVRPEGQSEGSFRVDANRVIVDRLLPEERSWRKFPDHRSETKAVKEALKKAGIESEVGHGRGTSWGWLEINIGDPRTRNGLKAPPFEYQYTDKEMALQNEVLKIAQEVTGRHGEYHGEIIVLAQGWRKPGSHVRPEKVSAAPEKETVEQESIKTEVYSIKPVPEKPVTIPEPDKEKEKSVVVKKKVKKHRYASKPEIIHTEYGRTVIKKAKGSTIKLTEADMRADAILISY